MALPPRDGWSGVERALRRAVSQHEDNPQLLYALASLFCSVGRDVEALGLVQRIARIAAPQPQIYFCHIRLLWAVNRLDEADRVLAEAASLYPTHFAIWFARFYLLMYSGRAGAAISLAQDRDRLPSGIPQNNVDSALRAAQAIQSQAPDAIAAVLAENRALAHQGAGYAENGIAFACAVGRIDDAFALAEAYYFGRGFVVPDVRWSRTQGTYTPQRERLTAFLFVPPVSSMHTDPRFEGLMTELGLNRYWQQTGISPDYRSRAA
jgi:tetratricopeptide (TPR) repeat protein